MKLVINVDDYKIEACKRRKEEGQNTWYHDMVLNGKPLEKEMVKELEKIKQEVVKMSYDCEIATVDRYKIEKLLDNHISELKGEQE